MPIKKYGIYLAYPPTVDLRQRGLGRHLRAFLKAAQHRTDVHFVIAGPSWMKENLIELLKDADIAADRFEILTPHRKPQLVAYYQAWVSFINQLKIKKIYHSYNRQKKHSQNFTQKLSSFLLNARDFICNTRSPILFLVVSPAVLFFITAKIILTSILSVCYSSLRNLLVKIFSRTSMFSKFIKKQTLKTSPSIFKNFFNFLASTISYLVNYSFKDFLNFIKHVITKKINFMQYAKSNKTIIALFQAITHRETELINDLINERIDITAWYCPAPCWPNFNKINAPRLTCIPDGVLIKFPIYFALYNSLSNPTSLKKIITEGECFVTYSKDVKWNTLVQHYQVDPTKIFIVPHGNNCENESLALSGSFSESEATQLAFCKELFKSALSKSINPISSNFFSHTLNVKYIFYATQFEPQKNIFTLIKAFDFLLKRNFIQHKLVLTGDPRKLKINEFIHARNLQKDVLCLHDLSTQELAACYKLADLAINPSLSEGGCPFTLTEALSVDTPVVMARIPVTLEVITDPELDKEMLFDPYDWKDMADRIAWALQNKESLLAKQKILYYSVLEKRTWGTVVDEYIDILDSISKKHDKDSQLQDAA